jgi:excisionase family DNA binding protein
MDYGLEKLREPAQVAKMIGVTPERVRKWLQDGTIGSVRIGKRRFIATSHLRALGGIFEEVDRELRD